ncbi:MAG: amidohydrolase family protein [Rhodobacteraceae bacterium]|nr:amidohydrolase family protein [Paracoccaceae bacterium]
MNTPDLNRRQFLAASGAAAVISALPAIAAQPKSSALIDTNVSLARWPFRRCPLDDTPALVSKLREHGVTQAWAGTFDALLHKDLTTANARLADECLRHGKGLLVPIGAINPTLPDWETDLRRCGEEHKMPGIRLLPNYHGYTLDAPVFERLLATATERGLLVQIALVLEDDRTQLALAKAAPTDAAPLPALLKKHPKARVQLLNAFRTLRGKPVLDLAAVGARFEIATLEGVAGIGRMLPQLPPDRLCFGSHAPFYYFESAKLKLQESVLTTTQLAALTHDNARKLLAA